MEAQILYMAMFPGNRTIHFRPELLDRLPNIIPEIPGGAEHRDTVCLADVSGRTCELYHDLAKEHILLYI